MQDFTITTKMRKSQLARVMLFRLYKSVGMIIATFFGLYLMVSSVLNYLKITGFNSSFTYNPTTDFILGFLFLLSPAFMTLVALRQLNSNPGFQQGITYTFSENELKVEASTFRAEYLWTHIKKQKETDKYLILYSNKRMGNFIDKSKLTPEQLQFIKSKVGQ